MTPRTRLGRVLLTGGDLTPWPRDACRTAEDVDRTVAHLGPLTDDERQDVADLRAELGMAAAGKRQGEAG